MTDDRKKLELVLRQIIQADKTAADIIKEANDTRQQIEQDTEKQRVEILAEADRQHQAMILQVQAERAEAQAERERQLGAQIAGQREALKAQVEAKRAGWIDDIVGRITASEG